MAASWSRRRFLTTSLAMTTLARAGQGSQAFLTPGMKGFEAARQPINSVIKLQPALIAPCHTEGEVVAAVKRAVADDLPIAVKSGGHAFHGFSLNQGGLLIELSGLRNRLLEADSNRFTGGPGLKLRDCYSWLLENGRFLPAGSCGGVGLAGLTLGGGYGLFSREFGLTCDHLEHVRLVDGQGELRDSRDEPELLWACRGGGNGNFGVVTSMSFKTQVAPPRLASWRFRSTGNDVSSFVRQMKGWFEIMADLPSPIFAALVLNGTQATVLLTSTKPKTGPAFQRTAKALKAAGFTTRGALERPFKDGIKSYEGRPGPLPFDNVSGGYYRGFSDLESVASGIAESVIKTPGLIFQINTLGGVIDQGPESAYPHRGWPFLGELQAYWNKGTIPDRLAAGHAKVRGLLKQAGISRHYRNYPDPRLEHWESDYFGASYPRLQEIKARFDPEDRFRHPQSVRLPRGH